MLDQVDSKSSPTSEDMKTMKNEWVRDGKQQIIGSKVVDKDTGTTIARNRDGKILGHSSQLFRNTRDTQGRLVRSNEPDIDCLFER
jgi:hypothetical protein